MASGAGSIGAVVALCCALAAPASAAVEFGRPTGFAVGSAPSGVAIADFNGDGKPDLAVTSSGDSMTSILLGDGGGGFAAAPGSPLTDPGGMSTNLGVAAGDFNSNNDSKPDLVVVAGGGSPDAAIFLGNGSGGFSSGTAIGSSSAALAGVAAGRFDADANLDFATGSMLGTPGTVSLFLGNGSGGFGAPSTLGPAGIGNSPLRPASADFNGDGKADLAIANQGSSSVTILLGNGTGGFSQPAGSPIALGFSPVAVAAGDLDADGRQDLAVADLASGALSFLLGRGDGVTFDPGGTLAAGSSPSAAAIADLNRDGSQDLAVANSSANSVSIFLGASRSAAASSPATGALPAPSAAPAFAVPDTTAPTQTISIPHQTIASVLRDGLIVFASCSEPCLMRSQIQIPGAKRKRKHGRASGRTPMLTVGAANAELAQVRRRVRIKVRGRGRTYLNNARKARLALATTATDTTGNRSRGVRRFTLGRG
jgi:hypothetical protein